MYQFISGGHYRSPPKKIEKVRLKGIAWVFTSDTGVTMNEIDPPSGTLIKKRLDSLAIYSLLERSMNRALTPTTKLPRDRKKRINRDQFYRFSLNKINLGKDSPLFKALRVD
ncbi:hypothetical protein CDAR_170301 [Caerostris darwini]|uniref:Uncharacterized protein n=1 Tax=Caerostris darwini TaxID=1538125 RepID=A0AAV4VI87_9ARAC|nr:hypothetical protein CDAR_170301 [Caerostris darwini]